MESTTIVIKVKYGETLRRFNAHVNEAGQLDIDMGGLREKAVGLFNFDPDVDLTLTYIDEDGDVVTLVNEEDLHDVMRQSLNPLRITVKLNAEKGGRSYTRSSGTSTPMRSPGVQHPLPNLNSGVSEMLKYVPEPFSEVISKLPLEFASRAALSDPMVAELANRLSKLEKAYIKPLSEFQVGTESSTPSGAPGSEEETHTIMTLGHHHTPLTTTTGTTGTGTGFMGHHHTPGTGFNETTGTGMTGMTGTGTGMTGTGMTGTGIGHHHHHGMGIVGAGTAAGTTGVAATDTGAHASRGVSNMKATVKEKVAHASADAIAVGKKLTHPTNPAMKMAATQEAQAKKAAATERKFEEQALAGANEHGRMANARQGVANNMGNMTTPTTYNTNY